MIDPRVHFIGTSAARALIPTIAASDDQVWVVQRRAEPQVVLVPYALYLDMQAARVASSADPQETPQ